MRLLILLYALTAHARTGIFFTGPGGFDDPTSCPWKPCDPCPVGQYRDGCGNAELGACKPCDILDGFDLIPDGFYNNTCKYTIFTGTRLSTTTQATTDALTTGQITTTGQTTTGQTTKTTTGQTTKTTTGQTTSQTTTGQTTSQTTTSQITTGQTTSQTTNSQTTTSQITTSQTTTGQKASTTTTAQPTTTTTTTGQATPTTTAQATITTTFIQTTRASVTTFSMPLQMQVKVANISAFDPIPYIKIVANASGCPPCTNFTSPATCGYCIIFYNVSYKSVARRRLLTATATVDAKVIFLDESTAKAGLSTANTALSTNLQSLGATVTQQPQIIKEIYYVIQTPQTPAPAPPPPPPPPPPVVNSSSNLLIIAIVIILVILVAVIVTVLVFYCNQKPQPSQTPQLNPPPPQKRTQAQFRAYKAPRLLTQKIIRA